MLSAVDVPWTETRPGSFGNREKAALDSGQERPSRMVLVVVVVVIGGGGRKLKCHVDIESWLCIHWVHK